MMSSSGLGKQYSCTANKFSKFITQHRPLVAALTMFGYTITCVGFDIGF